MGLERKERLRLENKFKEVIETRETGIERANVDDNDNQMSQNSSSISTSDICSHSPHHQDCYTRQPIPPATPDPASSQKCYYRPPQNIRLLPREVSSYGEFLSLKSSHQCEECEDGGLFYNYTEVVEYPDPGPSRGVEGSPVLTCPNNQNARNPNVSKPETRKPSKKKFKCDKCSRMFEKQGNLIFHKNRKHR